MAFAYLGAIQLGVSAFTGPTKEKIKEKSTLSRIAVGSGKPVVQDMGDDLNQKSMQFFFDETFCDPQTELDNLRQARAQRTPLPFVYGDGDYTGAHFVVEEIEGEILKTSAAGRVVRIDVQVTLIEAPVTDLGALNADLAVAGAAALVGNAAVNVLAKIA